VKHIEYLKSLSSEKEKKSIEAYCMESEYENSMLRVWIFLIEDKKESNGIIYVSPTPQVLLPVKGLERVSIVTYKTPLLGILLRKNKNEIKRLRKLLKKKIFDITNIFDEVGIEKETFDKILEKNKKEAMSKPYRMKLTFNI